MSQSLCERVMNYILIVAQTWSKPKEAGDVPSREDEEDVPSGDDEEDVPSGDDEEDVPSREDEGESSEEDDFEFSADGFGPIWF